MDNLKVRFYLLGEQSYAAKAGHTWFPIQESDRCLLVHNLDAAEEVLQFVLDGASSSADAYRRYGPLYAYEIATYVGLSAPRRPAHRFVDRRPVDGTVVVAARWDPDRQAPDVRLSSFSYANAVSYQAFRDMPIVTPDALRSGLALALTRLSQTG